MQIEPASGEWLRQHALKCRARGGDISSSAITDRRCYVASRRQINLHRFSFFPIRRNLQNRRPAQSAMSDQHALPKLLPAKPGDNFRGDTSQIAVLLAVRGAEQQRRQRRPRLLNPQSKLPRQVVTECSRSHLRNGKSARCYHQRRRTAFVAVAPHQKLVRPPNLANVGAQKYLHSGGSALLFEHLCNLVRRTVAEKLPQRFFVVGNSMLLH